MTSNLVKSRIGINKVSTTVENLWESGWQEYAAQNDDAFDGIIILKRGSKKPAATGGIIFVQVKCGSDGYKKIQKQYPNHIGVALGEEYIDAHIPRWNSAPGPAVLIFVDDETSKTNPNAYWVDLRMDASYSPSNSGMILIPKSQRFSHHSKGDFHRLCGVNPIDRALEEITLSRTDGFIPNLGFKSSLRADAWKFYADWKNSPAIDNNPALGPILVNRVGWDHITRANRLPERVAQSWHLLGAAKKMITSCTNYWTLGNASSKTFSNGSTEVTDYLGLRAKVTFPHRHHSVVQVILRRSRVTATITNEAISQKIWFYSVYELRRG
jgi:hypothetical protein